MQMALNTSAAVFFAVWQKGRKYVTARARVYL
jgi:hypothetical protein